MKIFDSLASLDQIRGSPLSRLQEPEGRNTRPYQSRAGGRPFRSAASDRLANHRQKADGDSNASNTRHSDRPKCSQLRL